MESQYFKIVSIWGFETLLNWAIPLVCLHLSTSGLVQRPNYSFPWEDFSYLLNLLNAKIWGEISNANIRSEGKLPFDFYLSAPVIIRSCENVSLLQNMYFLRIRFCKSPVHTEFLSNLKLDISMIPFLCEIEMLPKHFYKLNKICLTFRKYQPLNTCHIWH